MFSVSSRTGKNLNRGLFLIDAAVSSGTSRKSNSSADITLLSYVAKVANEIPV